MTAIIPLQSKRTEESTAYYIGVDVGTSSARVCVINHGGDIVGYATEDIHQWQSEGEDFYVSLKSFFSSFERLK